MHDEEPSAVLVDKSEVELSGGQRSSVLSHDYHMTSRFVFQIPPSLADDEEPSTVLVDKSEVELSGDRTEVFSIVT